MSMMGYEQDPQQQGPPEDFAEIIRQMLEDGRHAASLAPDDEDTLLIEQATTLLAKILANVQKGNDQALGGTLSPQALRRAG